MMNIQRKITAGSEALEFFTMNEWTFKNDNIFALSDKMSTVDRLVIKLHVCNGFEGICLTIFRSFSFSMWI